MAWIQRISRLEQTEKEGIYRFLIPPSLFQRFRIDPLSYCDENGHKTVRFFSPKDDRTCLVEMKLKGMEDPLYSMEISDTGDYTQINWDFLIVNDPSSPKFTINVDQEGKDTLFGWATRNLPEEEKALGSGYSPGQVHKGLGLTKEVIHTLDHFCLMFDIKSIRLEALFYHNAITYERHGFSYFSGYQLMKRIHEQFQPGCMLYNKLDDSTPFRKSEFAFNVRGRSWAIHDGVLSDTDDEIFSEGWLSPVMYRMIQKPRGMITFPDPVY